MEEGRVRAVSEGNESWSRDNDLGSPFLRDGLRSSSPVLGSEECEKEMEKNIEQFTSVSSIGKDEDPLNLSAYRSPVRGLSC